MPSPRMAAGAGIVLIALALPVAAQTPPPSPPPSQANPARPSPSDPFGEAVTLPERKIVFLKGTANWDSAFETLVDAFKSVYGYLEKEGIPPAGTALTIYTQTDDVGFEYEAAVPIAQDPKSRPQGDIQVGQAP